MRNNYNLAAKILSDVINTSQLDEIGGGTEQSPSGAPAAVAPSKRLERRTPMPPLMTVDGLTIRGATRAVDDPFASGRLLSCALELCPSGTLRIRQVLPAGASRVQKAAATEKAEAWPVCLPGIRSPKIARHSAR